MLFGCQESTKNRDKNYRKKWRRRRRRRRIDIFCGDSFPFYLLVSRVYIFLRFSTRFSTRLLPGLSNAFLLIEWWKIQERIIYFPAKFYENGFEGERGIEKYCHPTPKHGSRWLSYAYSLRILLMRILVKQGKD